MAPPTGWPLRAPWAGLTTRRPRACWAGSPNSSPPAPFPRAMGRESLFMPNRIIGTGSYLPATVWTNQDLAKRIATSDEWIVARTGIRQRHIADDQQSTSDLALPAALQAIEAAGLQPRDIDLIIVATT